MLVQGVQSSKIGVIRIIIPDSSDGPGGDSGVSGGGSGGPGGDSGGPEGLIRFALGTLGAPAIS